ncbi:LacI family DNA-binding transcriptional regulator [Pelagicoccus albus]|uniref:LacI family DNA-binding transcriptional regulator n=1 Tax=Pelagicoccus albus TaxID=415222 RepID=A0A7X1B3L3_9BACT|nr:LacI family DNA-binding transcriptional regulator [Pelagicoccus albus]MBC2605018.1 LacI family DNA-binding transcriptional regulator [Pelagicoccus albus]
MSSVRELARELGLSHTTVSDALRNKPKVKKETRERVLDAARKAGYRYNPLAGALMSEMRRSSVGVFQGVLAVVDLECPEKRVKAAALYHKQISEGCREKALELGFKAELFVMGSELLTVSRLDTILNSRGIRGVILLPASTEPDISNLGWEKFAGIYTDYIIQRPALDTVCSDHFRSMVVALNKLKELGYKRPGFVLDSLHDERLLCRWEAAFRMHCLKDSGTQAPAPYVTNDLNEEGFRKWYAREKPDVVLCHKMRVFHWMENMGLNIPEQVGFCCLNTHMSEEPVSGLDLCPRTIGSRATELLVGQLHRNDYGVPEFASTTTIPAVWVDGPTTRQQ